VARIPLPDGDELIPRAEFAALLDVSPRTVQNYEQQGLPTAEVGGIRYTPRNEGLSWIAARIQRRNRRNPRRSRAA
jgi:phage terminase Nu1 subunit (DNA packaging protein)